VAARGRRPRVGQSLGRCAAAFLIASWLLSDKMDAEKTAPSPRVVRAINRGVDTIRADKEGGRAAMIKWAASIPTSPARWFAGNRQSDC